MRVSKIYAATSMISVPASATRLFSLETGKTISTIGMGTGSGAKLVQIDPAIVIVSHVICIQSALIIPGTCGPTGSDRGA